MKGKYRVIVQDKRIRYDFTIHRNITVIRGDSATGKTTLLDMLTAYATAGAESGTTVSCEKNCTVLTGMDWKNRLSGIHDSLVFMDELARFTASEDFAAAIRNTDNYYIIVSREPLANLPYSVDEIYGIRTSGKYGGLKQTYNEFYRIYGSRDSLVYQDPSLVIAEDSNSGYSFFRNIYDKKGISCVSANGKSNIHALLQKSAGTRILVIADGAAFGPEMERIHRLIESGHTIALYLPESFEWIILRSGLLKDSDINAILESPEDYIESSLYFSWERFFTALLVEKSQGSYLRYTKKTLNPVYLNDKERLAVSKVLSPLLDDDAAHSTR